METKEFSKQEAVLVGSGTSLSSVSPTIALVLSRPEEKSRREQVMLCADMSKAPTRGSSQQEPELSSTSAPLECGKSGPCVEGSGGSDRVRCNVKYRGDSGRQAALSVALCIHHDFHDLNRLLSITLPGEKLEELRRHPEIEYASANGVVHYCTFDSLRDVGAFDD